MKRTGIWAEYAAWLEDQGKKPSTIANYVSQASKVLDACDERVDTDAVEAAIAQVTPSMQNQYRSAWRRFSEWGALRGVLVPAVPATRRCSFPPEVAAALKLLRQDGLKPKLLVSLRWEIADAAFLAAAFPMAVCLVTPPGFSFDVVPLASAPAEALFRWGYPGRPLFDAPGAPVLPRSPVPAGPLPDVIECMTIRSMQRAIQSALDDSRM